MRAVLGCYVVCLRTRPTGPHLRHCIDRALVPRGELHPEVVVVQEAADQRLAAVSDVPPNLSRYPAVAARVPTSASARRSATPIGSVARWQAAKTAHHCACGRIVATSAMSIADNSSSVAAYDTKNASRPSHPHGDVNAARNVVRCSALITASDFICGAVESFW